MPNLMNRVVVTGSRGMLGRCIVAELQRRGVRVDAFSHAELDIGDVDAIRGRLAPMRPSLILNCAAFTRVDDCETQREHAMGVNGAGPGAMAEVVRESGGMLVHVSSDYIFEGKGPQAYRETDAVGPESTLSAYGLSKLEGDRRILASGCRHLIARTSWVYGVGGPNFVDTIVKAGRARPELKVVNDQRGRPTYAADLADGIFRLLDRGAEGVVNVTNSDECTWYEFAREILRQAKIETPVRPCTTEEFPRPARRPAFSVLDLTRFGELTGGVLRTWREALSSYLQVVGNAA